jgi:hypothetical protein
VPVNPRLDRPRFWALCLLTSFTKPLSPIGSIHVRTRVSGPRTVLQMHANNVRRLHHMVNEPAELQGYLVNAAQSLVKIVIYPIGFVCAVQCCILDVNRTASIPIFVFAGARRQGRDQYQRGRFAGQNSKLAQKLNITLQLCPWRFVGVKVVGNPLTVLWKYVPGTLTMSCE